jgi:nucleotide-binding universal stress UspA family protein
MPFKNILVPLSGLKDEIATQEGILRIAISAAVRHDAHVEALHVSADPRDAVVFVGEGMTSTMIEGIIDAAEQEGRDRSKNVRELFSRVTQDLNVPARKPGECHLSATLVEKVGREEEAVACRGRLADLIVLAKPQGDYEGGAPLTLESALRETGRPVVVTPPGSKGKFGGSISVAIAWNGSVEASRAVAFALSYLAAAEKVTVLSVDEGHPNGPTAEDLVNYLGCHGINATSTLVKDSGGRSAGQALLNEVNKVGADMLVMGAYSRSRMRRLIFGGVTSEVLDKTEIPVLMVH